MNGQYLAVSVLSIATALASGPPSNAGGGGGGGATGGVNPPGTAELRTLSERAPAGGSFQMKCMLTQPSPITTGGSRIPAGFDINGFAVSSPLGDTAGAALSTPSGITLSVISPNSDFGTNLDYPFLTVNLNVPAAASTGSTFTLDLQDPKFVSPTGPVTFVNPKPGTLIVGGSISVNGLFPGGGTWPAGTVISVHGKGFVPGTRLVAKMKINGVTYVSSTEMRFTLQQQTTLDSQPVTLSNPDGSTTTFFSYLRGSLIHQPSRALLQQTEPAFQTLTHGFATVGPLPVQSAGQFTALAIQNPTAGPVVVSFLLQRTGSVATVTLPSGGRVLDDLSVLLGAAVGAGDVVIVTATTGVQILGLYGDEKAVSVTPFLPAF